ncbi:MAG TPA: DUF899 family protein [Mycobacterium sp.]|nr:DUF899 family protein [Mycobacterium sp.]
MDKDYAFEGPDGKVALIDLFEGRSQLIIYHFMWLHDIDEGCPSCSFAVDNMPDPIHLNEDADTTVALMSRVPYARLSQLKARMGSQLPCRTATSIYDFQISSDESIASIEYGFKDKATLVPRGTGVGATNGADRHGVSASGQEGGKVLHTYSAYGVGADVMLSIQRFLNLTPPGRQRYINEWPRHDTYGTPDRHEYHH